MTDKKDRTQLSISTNTKDRLKKQANEEGRTMVGHIDFLVKDRAKRKNTE